MCFLLTRVVKFDLSRLLLGIGLWGPEIRILPQQIRLETVFPRSGVLIVEEKRRNEVSKKFIFKPVHGVNYYGRPEGLALFYVFLYLFFLGGCQSDIPESKSTLPNVETF